MTKRRSHRSEPTSSRRDYRGKDYRVQEPEPQSLKGKIQTTVLIKPVNDNQRKMVQSIRNNTITLVSGPAGTGKSLIALYEAIKYLNSQESPISKIFYVRSSVDMKEDKGIGFIPGPQPLYTKVLTPNGWVYHRDLEVGMEVSTPDGNTSQILGIYPKGHKDVYRIESSDGGVTEACLDHLWSVNTDINNRNSFHVVNTQEILSNLGKIKCYLPTSKEVEFLEDTEKLILPPYLLGCLLGDGGFADSHVRFYNMDSEIIDRVSKEASSLRCKLIQSECNDLSFTLVQEDLVRGFPSYEYKASSQEGEELFFNNYSEVCSYFSINRVALVNAIKRKRVFEGKYTLESIKPINCKINPIRRELEVLGLEGHNCYNKFIPDIYKYSSIETRVEVLRGLMDTDGNCKTTGEASFATTSKRLAEDVIEIVRSLGGRANLKSRERGPINVMGVDCNSVTSYQFTISLPNKYNPFYLSRKRDRFKTSCQYRNYIKNIELVGSEECQCILIDHPDHLYITDDYIVTHNTMVEKCIPLAYPVLDNLVEFMEEGKAQFLVEKEIIRILPISFVRGRSLADSFVIVDEAQNLSPHMIKALLTRISHGSKIIFLGDTGQIDIDNCKSGYLRVIGRLEGCRDVGSIAFTKADVTRHPLIQEILDRLEGLD